MNPDEIAQAAIGERYERPDYVDAKHRAIMAARRNQEPYAILSIGQGFWVGPDRVYKAVLRESICEVVSP